MATNIENRRVRDDTYRTCSIDDYVHDAALIWSKDRKRPIFDLWCHVLNHASKLGEALRREEYAEAGHQVGRVAVWLISFIARLQVPDKSGFDGLFYISTPLSEMIWSKYPKCCPVCYGDSVVIPRLKGSDVKDWDGERRICNCMLRLEDVETRNERYKPEVKEKIKRQLRTYADTHKPNESSAYSLDTLEKMFFEIFQPATTALTTESIGFHFLEEVGEVSEELTQLYSFKEKAEARRELYEARKVAVENEIADVFSWLFAVSSKLRLIYEKMDRSYKRLYPNSQGPAPLPNAPEMWVSKRIWAEYGVTQRKIFGCRVCKRLECECRIYLATTSKRAKALLVRWTPKFRQLAKRESRS